MTSPVASIVIPVFNTSHEDLNRSVRSALEQTLPDIEVILVDDGSRESVASDCDSISAADSRIVVVHQPNGGLSSARNAGVRRATGKWLMFLDSDDWISSDAIEKSVESGERNDVQLVMSAWVKEYGAKTESFPLEYREEKIFSASECRRLMVGLFDWDSRYHDITGKLFLRSLLIDNDLFHDEDVRMGSESLLFNLRVFYHLEKASYVPIETYHYVYNEGSISTGYSEAYYEGLLLSYRRARSLIEDFEGKDELLVGLRRHLPNVVAAMSVGCLLAPNSPLGYKEACEKAETFRAELLEIAAPDGFDLGGCSTTRRVTNKLLKTHLYLPVKLIAFVRYAQKNHSRH